MSRKPRIPMTPDALPQQRVYLVRGLPRPPLGWATLAEDKLQRLAPTTMPRSARYLGQVEWAWSPMHSRISGYYLSMDRSHRHWVLWDRPYDDNWGRWMEPCAVAAARRCAADANTAAKLLLVHTWSLERDDGLDQFHWVGEAAFLEAGEFNEIAAAVWDANVNGEVSEF